jgi:peptide chain release factor 2
VGFWTVFNLATPNCDTQIQNCKRWQSYLEDVAAAIELLQVESDQALFTEANTYLDRLTHELNQWEIEQLLCQPYDSRNARISIQAKIDDTEDWVLMLLQMYCRWATRQNHQVNCIHEAQDQCGILRSVTIEISGCNVYGYLKGEDGVHNLKQILPFKSKTKLQQSLALVQVVPIVDDEVMIEIPPEHWAIVNYVSQPWLRNRNKTDIGVRVTHLPTGLTFCAMLERNQLRNRDKAIAVLTTQLIWIMQQHQLQDLAQIRGSMLAIDWQHPIRQYCFDPTPLVIDYRSGYRSPAVKELLAGKMDNLLEFGIRANSTDRPNQLSN